jgi:hypothetical protein
LCSSASRSGWFRGRFYPVPGRLSIPRGPGCIAATRALHRRKSLDNKARPDRGPRSDSP